jgi:hypothetical protein
MAGKKQTKIKKANEKKAEAEKILFEKIEMGEKIEEKKENQVEPNKKQIFGESRTLLIIGGVLLLLVIMFVGYFIFSNSSQSFVYNNVKYTLIQEGKLAFYNTQVSVTTGLYNVYLRNDPRKLEQTVPFNGSMHISSLMNLNYSNDINCDGFGTIGIANIVNLYDALGTKIVRDSNSSCDPQGRYVDINIVVSNKTSIQEIAPGCYQINVANCEILPATERYVAETASYLRAPAIVPVK